MFGMAIDSAKLFLAGKLFQNNTKVMQQLILGILAGLIVIIVLGQFTPLWLAAALGGLASGFLQPILFKNLKYQ